MVSDNFIATVGCCNAKTAMMVVFFKLYSPPLSQEERINAEMKTKESIGQMRTNDHMTCS